MCTKFDDKIGKRYSYGYKVVKIRVQTNTGIANRRTISMIYSDYVWKKGINIARNRWAGIERIDYDKNQYTFHCFKYLRDARLCAKLDKELYNYSGVMGSNFIRIIKVKLLNKVKCGILVDYFKELDNTPQLCSNRVYWDGKFIG